MGTLSYGAWTVEFEDRLLTHLQIVIVNRLRRGDSLLISWLDSTDVGDGRSAIWTTPGTPIYFKFAGSRVPAIDQAWLKHLDDSAGSSTGLIVGGPDGRPIAAGTGGALHRTPPQLHPPPRPEHPLTERRAMRPGPAILEITAPSHDSGSGAAVTSHQPPPDLDVRRQVADLLRAAAQLHERDGRPDLAAAHRMRATVLELNRSGHPLS